MFRALPALALLALLAACAPRTVGTGAASTSGVPESALARIDSAALYPPLAELASDAYEGRGTGTPGEERTVAYVAERMRRAGLEGGAADGSFFQPVPLRGSTPVEVGELVLTPDDTEPARLAFVDDFIASTDLDAEAASISNAELVFVGYGIQNEGYGWDDYKDADVRGKVIVAFVNDPPATAGEPGLFQADTLTYNGRWTYKYEEARRRGALGALLIHTPETAGYGFQVLSAGARGEQIDLSEPPENPLTVKGWLTQASAERLARMSGSSLDEWLAAAATRDFQPRPLPVTASLAMTFETRRFEGTNVIGKLEGSERPHEAVVYTAHHDHLGKDEGLIAQGRDGIYNGAVDNASGVAMMVALAEAFAAAPEPPARTVLFMTLSAEESGLLGAAHYAQSPVVPLAHTIANINVDSANLYGPTEDLVGIGAERSEMLGLLREAAAAEGMTVSPDTAPGQGRFFRSDQLAFARGGVPAVYLRAGNRYVGRDAEYGRRIEEDYRANRYHQPSDELMDDMTMGGLVQLTRVSFLLGWRLADSDLRPAWNPSEAFAQTRAASERAAGL